MKVDILDAHDRLEYFKKQDFSIGECCQSLIDQRPFGDYAFYIFAHPRTEDDGITKRMIWQPRLTKPKAQTNSMLFKGNPGTDIVKVIWIIPSRELWDTFQKGNITESCVVSESIHNFLHNKDLLESKEDDDLSEETINRIYQQISKESRYKKI